MELDRIYSDLILAASQNPKNYRILEPADVRELGHNPSCGDEITLMVRYDGDRIEEIAFTGEGCAISRASTSLMIDVLRGKTKEEALEIIRLYLSMIRGQALTTEEKRQLRDARVFENIKNLPARAKCATLSWHTMEHLLEHKADPQ